MDGRREEVVAAGSGGGGAGDVDVDVARPPHNAAPVLLPPPLGDGGGTDSEATDDDANDYEEREAFGFREAVRLLEGADDDNDRRPIYQLYVYGGSESSRADDARSFPRFVALLGQREGGRAVRFVDLLMDWRGLPDRDMERLFRDVLPGHRTLEYTLININRLPARFLKVMAENLPTESGDGRLSGLGLLSHKDFEAAEQENYVTPVVDMLNRNVAISELALRFKIDADQCKRICQALPRATTLRDLSLRVKEIFADTLDGAAAPSLQVLHVSGFFSMDAVSSLVRQLRTNETLRTLSLQGRRHLDPQALLDLVKTYNYTIRRLDTGTEWHYDDARVRECMRRNGRIRQGLKQLQSRDPDTDLRLAVPKRLLPSLLGLVSDLPTLLYRILKQGYVNLVGDRLAAQVTASTATLATTTATTIESQ